MPQGTLRVPALEGTQSVPGCIPTRSVGTIRLRIWLERCFCLQLQIIQRPIHRQFTQHDQLRNAQQHMSLRAVHQPGEVSGHGFGASQGFRGIGQQFFAVDAGGDEVTSVGFEHRFSGEQRIEVVIEGAFGGFVECLGVEGLVGRGGCRFRVGWVLV